ncbi:uroporphyrinogen-III synthase [Paraliobacillus sp. PM-2]|uniref:uroporphyrinogen-III synthase n=1 Tax=Paraliobacillus sp. PM-2 TaxID=1462524 RepID=UPI00061B8DDC|nr:uroporphyrinogen-III synthase [Paraliobacillus sp. PM-2]CQR48044.1 uroporphyrinogen-III synthase [Paraliobacillus sp. PM-2]
MSDPLKGKKILVTRSSEQARPMMEGLYALGAEPKHVPLITFQAKCVDENRKKLNQIKDYDWIFFTSANGVRFFFENMQYYQISQSQLKDVKFAVIGEKSEQTLQFYGYQASFLPSKYQATEMADQFVYFFGKDNRVLLALGNKSSLEVQKVLTNKAIETEMIIVYETLNETAYQEALTKWIKQDKLDVYTFTSPSTVHSFDDQTKGIPDETAYIKNNRLCVCIGTTTEQAALASGFQQVLIPTKFTTEAMIQVISEYFS